MPLSFTSAALADLAAWREAWRDRSVNPLAGAVALALARQAGGKRQRGNRLLLRILLVLGVAGLALLLCDLAGLLPGKWDTALGIAGCAGAAAYCLVWLITELWGGLSQASTALARQEKRASWVQLDDLLAITSLTAQEILVGLLWAPWLCLLRASLALVLLTLCCCLPFWLGARSFFWDTSDSPNAVLLLPFTVASLGGCAVLSTASMALFAAIMNRGLVASRLLPFAGTALLFSSLAWLPMSLSFYFSGVNDFSRYEAPALADLGNLLGGLLIAVLTVHLLALGARFRPLRVFAALFGGSAVAVLHLLAWIIFGAASMTAQLDSRVNEFMGIMMMASFRGWGAFALINPAALPSDLCLGFQHSPGAPGYSPWGLGGSAICTAWWPLAYLLGGAALLLVLSRHAVMAVEARRSGAD